MGLLDRMWSDPSGQAITALASGLLGVRRGDEGRAIMGGLGAYNNAQQEQRRNQLTQAQLSEISSQGAYRSAQASEWMRKAQEEAERRRRIEAHALTLPPGQRGAFLLAPEKWAESQFAVPKAATPSDLGRLLAERDALPPGHPDLPRYNAAIKKVTEFAPPMSLMVPPPVTYIQGVGPDGTPQYYAAPTRQGGTPQPTGISPIPPKPKQMPPTAARIEQERLAEIATVNTINTSLDSFIKKIDSGEMNLSLFANAWNSGLNTMGQSTQGSRNFASFKATLEKMRNDSLRLNNGVQTEGDAQRAWNELLANINDTDLVKQRLSEIKALNARAALLKRGQIEVQRESLGIDPLTEEQILKATGGDQAPATATAPPVGTIKDGYRFKGGHPADPASWEKI